MALLYFILSIGSNPKELLNVHYKESAAFIHPVYSLLHYGSQYHTKTSRITLMTVNFSAQWIACAFIHRILEDKEDGMRVGVGLAVGFGFGWLVSYIFGAILRGLINCHREYLKDIKTCDTHEKREVRMDKYDNSRLSWNYLFYSFAFAVFSGAGWGSIGLLIDFNNAQFWWFMLSLGICVFGELLFLDFIKIGIAKSSQGFFRNSGFYIDFQLEEEFESYNADHQ